MSPVSRVRKSLILMGVLCVLPALVFAQTNGLQGGDVPFTGGLRGDQVFPASAIGSAGGFYLWQDSITDPFGLGVSAQRLDANLAPVGPVLRVNQTIPLDQSRPKAAMQSDGGAFFTWQSGRSGLQHVFARRIAADGVFATDEILLNNPALKLSHTYVTNLTLIRNNKARTRPTKIKESIRVQQEFNANPSVIVLADGSAVAAWSSSRRYQTNTTTTRETLTFKESGDGLSFILITNRTRVPVTIRTAGMQDVYAQRLSASGVKIDSEFRVNEFTTYNQRDVTLAALPGGGFVAAWVSEQQKTGRVADIYARIFDAVGNAGAEFLVSTGSARPSGSPSVAAVAGGGFTIAWTQGGAQRTNGLEIMARVYDGAGAPLGEPFLVNTFTYGDQFAPSVVSAGAQQLVVWSSLGQDGSWEGVFAQSLSGAVKLGGEFRVNVARAGSQKQPAVVGDGAGRALILWSGYGAGGAGFDLFGRTYVAP